MKTFYVQNVCQAFPELMGHCSVCVIVRGVGKLLWTIVLVFLDPLTYLTTWKITKHGDARFSTWDNLSNLIISCSHTVFMPTSGQTRSSSDWSEALNAAGVKDKEKETPMGPLMYVPVPWERLYYTLHTTQRHTHTHTHTTTVTWGNEGTKKLMEMWKDRERGLRVAVSHPEANGW